MSHAWVLWVLAACSALHVVEEYSFGWQGWAVANLGPKFGVWVSTTAFWVTNASGHVMPSIQARRPNPGLFTGVLLYVPIGIWAYAAAAHDHVLNPWNALLSIVVGAVLLAQALIIPRFGPRMRYADVRIPDAIEPVAVSVEQVRGRSS
jgi:hypothetical protein